jgi:hypothetical protein
MSRRLRPVAALALVGVMAGAVATAVYASSKSWAIVIPVEHPGCRLPWPCGRCEMELGRLEPPTSWVRFTSSG